MVTAKRNCILQQSHSVNLMATICLTKHTQSLSGKTIKNDYIYLKKNRSIVKMEMAFMYRKICKVLS